MQFPRGPVTNKLVIINLVIAAVLLVPSWWNYAVMAGGFFPIRFSNVAVAFPDTGFLVPTYLTPLSAAFLHGGIAHVLMNMLTLLLIGKMVERVLGGGLYLSLYFFSAALRMPVRVMVLILLATTSEGAQSRSEKQEAPGALRHAFL